MITVSFALIIHLGTRMCMHCIVSRNETPPPEELLGSLPIPDAEKVSAVACTAAIEEAGALV